MLATTGVVGAILRLEGNLDKGTQPLDHLLSGLKYMAEEPNERVLRCDYPVLSELVYAGASGSHYNQTA